MFLIITEKNSDLINNSNQIIIENLGLQCFSIDDFLSVSPIVVYQDSHYVFELCDIENKGKLVNIVINNEEINLDRDINVKYISEQKKYYIDFRYILPFNLTYGITDICFVFEEAEANTCIYTPFLSVASKKLYGETTNAIKEMLDDIYLKDHKLLITQKDVTDSESIITAIGKNDIENTIYYLTNLVIVLKQNYNNFIHNPKTKSITVNKIDNYEKAKNFNSNSISFIMNHPENLHNVKNNEGIKIGKKYYLPNKTMVSAISDSVDIYENRTIMSFINTVTNFTKDMKNKIQNELNLSDRYKYNVPIKENYELQYSIIESYIKFSYTDYLQQYKKIYEQLQELQNKYYNNFLSSYDKLNKIPKPTHTFLEIHHYNILFKYIVSWFSLSVPNIPKQNAIRHFYNADKIYEYYCLLNIVDIIQKLGYKEDVSKRKNFIYNIGKHKYEINNCDSNTLLFSNENNVKITLYYQPIIYSDNRYNRNQINLFRTTDNTYYTPDYLIKIEKNEQTEYGIIDAKFRNQKQLLKTGCLQECIYKYYNSVRDIDSLNHVKFMWLLQGKVDNKSIYRLNNSSVSKEKDTAFRNQIGILPFTPNSNKYSAMELFNILLK